MKKLLAAILVMAFILTACGETAKGPENTADANSPAQEAGAFADEPDAEEDEPVQLEDTALVHSQWSNLGLNGAFFTKADGVEVLYFIDFDTMQAAPVCPRPNCAHNDPEECAAIGISNHPIVWNSDIYYFYNSSGWNDNHELYQCCEISKTSLDGGGRSKITSIDGVWLESYSNVATKGSVIYFVGTVDEMDDTGSTGYKEYKLYAFDCETKKLFELATLHSGYNSGYNLHGEYDGAIWISGSYCEDEVNIFNDDFTMVENWAELLDEATIEVVFRYDLETGELSESDLPMPAIVGGGYYCYDEDDGNAVVIDSDGNKTVYDSFSAIYLSTGYLVNGYIFNIHDGKALNLVTGEVRDLNLNVIEVTDTVIDYVDGSYIVSRNLDEFEKVSESDFFA